MLVSIETKTHVDLGIQKHSLYSREFLFAGMILRDFSPVRMHRCQKSNIS